MPEQKSVILFVQGGAGDVLAHTPMIRGMRKTYPEDKIVVLSTYSQLLEGNPNIDELITLKDPKDFYSFNVLGRNIRFFRKRFVYDYILEKESEPYLGATTLPEFICRCFGVEYDGGHLDYYITDYEKRATTTYLSQFRKDLPLVLIHSQCAIPSDGAFNKTNKLKDIPVPLLAKIVEKYKEKMMFVQVGLLGETVVPGAIDALGQPLREAIALLANAKSYILAESIFAHCTNALGLSGVVLFQNTDPTFFGYANNFNVSDSGGCDIWPCNRPVGALLDFAPGFKDIKNRAAGLWECHDQKCARMGFEALEEVLLESLKKPKVVSAKADSAVAAADIPAPGTK